MTKPLTYDSCLAAYRALLKDKPRQALVISRELCVRLMDERLIGLYYDADKHIVPASEFDLDRSAWSADRSCWNDESPEQTLARIESPTFITMIPRKRKEKTWGAERFEFIMKEARERYGRGWDHLSKDARDNFIHSRILFLMLGQGGEKFAPAQDLVRQVFEAQAEAEA